MGRSKVVNGKEIVDRCRFRRLFCEAIRLRQSHEFVAADPLDQAVVVLTDCGFERAPPGDSSRTSTARSNAAVAASR